MTSWLPGSRAPKSLPSVGWTRALVTGASAGIGRACCEILAAQGIDLVIVARDRQRLEALAAELAERSHIDVEVLAADLSDRAQLVSVADRLSDTDRPVDVLINNAGFGYAGDFIDLEADAEASVIDVNVSALHRLAHAAGGAMAARGRGWILNVSSIAGFSPSPKAATYAATKAFVTSFSQALYAELGPQGVVVSCLCPGLTRTEFHQRAGIDNTAVPDLVWQTAETVAMAGLVGLAKSKPMIVPGAQNKAVQGMTKALPAGLLRSVAIKVNARNNR